jgi:acyl carrier protein
MHSQAIREIIAQHARLRTDVSSLDDDADLYEAGLTSLSTVNLMLALEERFDVEFLDRMLKRRTFQSIRSLSEAIAELKGDCPASGAPHLPDVESARQLRGVA